MNTSKAIVCKEPEFIKEATSLRLILLEKEEYLFSVIEEICRLECLLKDFLKRELEPKLGHLQKRLENLKFLVLGQSKSYEKAAEKKDSLNLLEEKELKRLYRSLAKIYHPDSKKDDEGKKFFISRMKEINEAFANKNLKVLRSIFRKSAREIEGEKSAFWIVKALKEEIRITESVIEIYLKKLSDFKSSKKYSLMKMGQKELTLEISKMEMDLRREIEIYSSILYGRNKNSGLARIR